MALLESLRAAAAALVLAGGFAASALAGAFLTGTEDIPLMPGLHEEPGAGLVFDTPGGRIVEAYARGDSGREQVMSFYAQTLPQLGWTTNPDGSFRRDAERLRLDVTGGHPVTVHFIVSPE